MGIPASWHLRTVSTDAIPFLDSSQEPNQSKTHPLYVLS